MRCMLLFTDIDNNIGISISITITIIHSRVMATVTPSHTAGSDGERSQIVGDD